MTLIVPIVVVFGSIFFALAIAAVIYLDRISKDARLVQQLLAAYLKRTVAGTVADHELADVVRKATESKAPAPAGVVR